MEVEKREKVSGKEETKKMKLKVLLSQQILAHTHGEPHSHSLTLSSSTPSPSHPSLPHPLIPHSLTPSPSHP